MGKGKKGHRNQKSIPIPLPVFLAASSARPASTSAPSAPSTNVWGPGSAHSKQVEERRKLAEETRLKEKQEAQRKEQEAQRKKKEAQRKQEEDDKLAKQARAEEEQEWLLNRVRTLQFYNETIERYVWKLCAIIWPRGVRSKGFYDPNDKWKCIIFLLQNYKQIVRWFQGEFKDILFEQGQKIYDPEDLQMVLAFLRPDQLKDRQIEKLELLLILYEFTAQDKAGLNIQNMEAQLSKWQSEQDLDRKMKLVRDFVRKNY